MAGPRVEVQVTGDTKGLSRAFADAGSASSKLGTSLSKLGKVAGIAFVALGAGAAAGITKSIKAASDLNEQINKANVVFGESGKEVADWSGGLARSFGISSRAALEAAGTFGNMLVPMGFARSDAADMSKKMVELAGDMSSFNNASPADTLEALRAGLAGESEPLRKFGVFLNDARLKQEALSMGLYSGKGALDANAKAAATYSLILKDTKDAQGDFARTNDGLANAQRSIQASFENISASLGSKFLPVIAGAASGVADFLDKLDKADGGAAKLHVVLDTLRGLASQAWDALKKAFNDINWGAVWDTVATKIKGGGGKLYTATRDAIQSVDWEGAVKAAGDRTGRGIVAALNTLDDWVNKADWNSVGEAMVKGFAKAVGAAALYLAHVDWKGIVFSVVKLWVGAWKVYTEVLIGAGRTAGEAVFNGIKSGMEGIVDWVRQKLTAVREAVVQAAKWVYGNALEIGKQIVQGIIDGIGDLISRVGGAIASKVRGAIDWAKDHVGSTAAEYANRIIGVTIPAGIADGIEKAQDEIGQTLATALGQAIDRAQAVVESRRGQFQSAWGTLASAAGSAFDAIYGDVKTPAEKALAVIQRSEEDKQRATALANAQAAVNQAQTDAEKLAAQEQLRQAQLAILVAGLQDQAAEERKQLDAQNAVRREKLQERLADLMAKLGEEGATHKQAHAAITKLFADFGIDYKNSGAALGDAFVDGIRSKIKAVEKAAEALAKAASITAKITVALSKTGAASGIGGAVDGARAAGGPVSAGRTYLVGERGPELFTAERSGQIVPNRRLSAGGVVPSVNVSAGVIVTERQLEDMIRDIVKRMARRNGGNAWDGLVAA